MRRLATAAVRALRAAEIPARVRHRFTSSDAVALRWASSCADLVAGADVAHMSDAELTTELRALGATPDLLTDAPILARALAIVTVAMQRRLGTWRVFERDDLSGPLGTCLETASIIGESVCSASPTGDPADLEFVDTVAFQSALEARLDSHRLNDSQREVVRWLVYVGGKTRLAQPDEISLPSSFYAALCHLDADGSLRFDPTREQIMTAALLVRGAIVEMDAGEGKTVSAGMAAAATASRTSGATGTPPVGLQPTLRRCSGESRSAKSGAGTGGA